MIQQIAIGETTGKIYARGTHAECSRRLNRTKQFLKEPIRIVKAEREYELLEKQIIETVPVKRDKKKVSKIEWTDERNAFIVENTNLHVDVLVEKFNYHFNTNASRASVNTRRTNLRNGVFMTGGSTSKMWTQEEEAYLAESYGKVSTSEIARNVNRSRNTVKTKANRMGLEGNK